MMDTREINSFPVVTSLSSSDYLLTDSGKKILEQNVGRRVVNASLGEGAKWIRIAEFSGSAVGIISITNSWYYQVPQSLLIAFAVPGVISSVPVYTILNLLLGKTEVFNKARMVYSTNGTFSTKCYLEVYQHISTETAYIVEMQNHRNATALCELGSIPEGWSTKEFTFTAVGGGNLLVIKQLRNLAERRVA